MEVFKEGNTENWIDHARVFILSVIGRRDE